MSISRFRSQLNRIAGLVLLVTGLAVAGLAYAPGLSGTIHFDDAVNLGGLTDVVDGTSAVRFIAEGSGGPSGRPLALASFVPQAHAWPDSPEVFVRANVGLHLLNGVLVAWLLYLLAVSRGSAPERAGWVAASSATIWMLLPILASSSLLIVQRMTLLSATFVLLGFVGYLYSRLLLERREHIALVSMTACVVSGTVLATLAKENGALLPVLILVTEATLLPRPSRGSAQSFHRLWTWFFLAAPAAFLIGYLVLNARYAESTILVRGFSAPDRLLTQAHILWEYLYHAFLPATSNLGPFQDDHTTYTNWAHPLSIVAVGAWVLVAVVAFKLRRQVPLLTFAVGWYLAGHLLESTTIALELYFEHRNYVPLMGPVFALVAAVAAAPKWPRLAQLGLFVYSLLLAVVLVAHTSLWGRPVLAGEIWANHHPDSPRATQYLVRHLEEDGNSWAARRALSRYVERNPGRVAAVLQILSLTCLLEPEEVHGGDLARAKAQLRHASFDSSVFESLRVLQRVAEEARCGAIKPQLVYDLAKANASNPAYQARPAAHHNLHILMAEYAFAQRDLDLTMRHIEAALEANYVMSSLKLAVEMLQSAGLHATAQGFIEDARTNEPRHPLKAMVWREQLAALDRSVRKATEQ